MLENLSESDMLTGLELLKAVAEKDVDAFRATLAGLDETSRENMLETFRAQREFFTLPEVTHILETGDLTAE